MWVRVLSSDDFRHYPPVICYNIDDVECLNVRIVTSSKPKIIRKKYISFSVVFNRFATAGVQKKKITNF